MITKCALQNNNTKGMHLKALDVFQRLTLLLLQNEYLALGKG
jgi:hypothetical protein